MLKYLEALENLQKNSLISTFQSGFTSKHSTLTMLLQICDKWEYESMDESKIIGLISIDIKKAFDFISHQILLSKMQNILVFTIMNWISLLPLWLTINKSAV